MSDLETTPTRCAAPNTLPTSPETNALSSGWIWLAGIFYLLLAGFSLPLYQDYVTPDAISQISIAKKYMAGNFLEAFNGYWGPLLSWLLMPFLAFGLKPVLAFRVLQVCVGPLTIWGLYRLSCRFDLTRGVRLAALFSFIPMTYYFTFYQTTADFLFICVVSHYLATAMSPKLKEKVSVGFLAGILGALTYFAKCFGLSYFVATFLVFLILRLIQAETEQERKNTLRSGMAGLGVAVLLVGLWAVCLHARYNEWILSTTGRYHWAINSPQVFKRENLPHYQKMMPSLEDPSEDPSLKPWSPLASKADLAWYLKTREDFFRTMLSFHHQYYPFTAVTLLGFCLLLLKGRGFKLDFRSPRWYPLLAVLIYLGGYLVIINRPTWRYFWPAGMLLFFMGADLLSLLFRKVSLGGLQKTVAITLFLLFSLMLPVTDVVHFAGRGKDVYAASQELKAQVTPGSKVASNAEYQRSGFLAFHLEMCNFGAPSPKITPEDLDAEIQKNGLDYFLLWDASAAPKPTGLLLARCEQTPVQALPGLTLLRLPTATDKK